MLCLHSLKCARRMRRSSSWLRLSEAKPSRPPSSIEAPRTASHPKIFIDSVTAKGPLFRFLKSKTPAIALEVSQTLSGLSLMMKQSVLLTLVLCSSISQNKLPLKSSKQIRLFYAGRTWDHCLDSHCWQASRSMETTNVVHTIGLITSRSWMQIDSTGLSTDRWGLANTTLISQ